MMKTVLGKSLVVSRLNANSVLQIVKCVENVEMVLKLLRVFNAGTACSDFIRLTGQNERFK